MTKSVRLYFIIITVWISLTIITLIPFIQSIQHSESHGVLVTTLVCMSTMFVIYFWLNGIKDLVYTAYYYMYRKRFTFPLEGEWRKKYGNLASKKVVVVYCTYNDFNGLSLEQSMSQDYPNVTFVILDDSTETTYIQAVKCFAEEKGLQVVRRLDRTGFKAGNLNHYLKDAAFDYFVLLDSDEIIPSNFITRCLDYFAEYSNVGIVQANHIATRSRNKFMRLFAIGVNSHWPTYQTVKHYHGFLSLLGHGAMVSKACYEAAGGFPHVVAEDLCLSIEARDKGFYTAFAQDITCEEEYPISYLAFKKRHSKWTQGNMEFIKRYTWSILRSRMTWYEKLDIILFTYSLPLSAFFALYIIINVILLPSLHYTIMYPSWLLIPTILFLIAPMLNDIIFHAGKVRPLKLLWYTFHTILLYGSMLFTSLRASFKSLFGKSIFLVTPKEHEYLSRVKAFRANIGEIVFGISVLVIAFIFNQTILSTIVIAIPGLFSVYLALMANAE